MTIEEMREAIASPEGIAANSSQVLAALAAQVSLAPSEESTEMHEAREIAIRMVAHRDALADGAPALDAILRRVGLFPYLQPDLLGVRDILAYEAHRPLDSPDPELVFHRAQAEAYRRLLEGENVVLSAPTSFGKSLVIDSIIASRVHRNVVVLVPTIALIDETRRRLNRFSSDYTLITNVSQRLGERNLLILTQERLLEMTTLPNVDFFALDEFYKLSPDREPEDARDRTYLLNQAFHLLYRTGAQFYFLGPNIAALDDAIPADFLGRVTFIRTEFSTVALDEIRVPVGPDPLATLTDLCRELADPTLIYCKSPASVREVLAALLEGGVGERALAIDPAVEWLSKAFHRQWSLCRGLEQGIGVHHGQLPRAVAHFLVRAFREERLRFLICTSTLIEGVNTPAKNVVVFDKEIGRTDFDFFDFGNIRGRGGRMAVHHVGRVYLFHPRPAERLPDVDIPALSQPPDTPSSLLLAIPEEDLSPASLERLHRLLDGANLPVAVLHANTGLSIELQTEAATVIEADLDHWAPRLAWEGMPKWTNLEAVCDLIWEQLNGARTQHGVGSGGQLAARLLMLGQYPDPADLISIEFGSNHHATRHSSVDEVTESVLDFCRFWSSHTFPNLLRALAQIANAVLSRNGLPGCDYSVYASRVENCFQPPTVISLEEFGLPRDLALDLADLLPLAEGLEPTLKALIDLPTHPEGLTPFQVELLDDVRNSIPHG